MRSRGRRTLSSRGPAQRLLFLALRLHSGTIGGSLGSAFGIGPGCASCARRGRWFVLGGRAGCTFAATWATPFVFGFSQQRIILHVDHVAVLMHAVDHVAGVLGFVDRL